MNNKKQVHTFDWSGKNARGRMVKGTIVEDNIGSARLALRRQNIEIKKISKRLNLGFLSQKKIKSIDITVFARQIATMLKSGLTLINSFGIVADGTANLKLKNIILSIKADVEAGTTFADSLRKHPMYFDNLFCSLVSAGEKSGKLEELLDQIASYKERNEILKQKIKKAMKYPMTVIVAAVIVTVILMLKVIPVFKDLFESFGGELPGFTQMVVNASEFTQQYWLFMLAGAAVLIYAIKTTLSRSPRAQDLMQRMSLKVPIFGDLVYKGIIARFASTLKTNYQAGVPLIEGLRSAGDACGNIAYREAIEDIAMDVATGQNLAFAMKQSCMFPELCVQLTTIGEESGALESMLGKVANYYENEVNNAVDGLTAMMEPLIMAFLGVIVGGLVVAMYLPIFQMGAVV